MNIIFKKYETFSSRYDGIFIEISNTDKAALAYYKCTNIEKPYKDTFLFNFLCEKYDLKTEYSLRNLWSHSDSELMVILLKEFEKLAINEKIDIITIDKDYVHHIYMYDLGYTRINDCFFKILKK